MNKLERSIQKNAFNEDELFNKIQAKNQDQKSYSFFGGKSMKKIVSITALSFALIFAVWFGFNQNNVITEEPVVMLVGIDINPSFELSVNKNDKVVEIEALNDDAKTIIVTDLIDQDIEYVVEEIILRSEQAGFFTVYDLDEDYVVISTVSLNDDEDDQDEMEEQLEKKIRDSEYLQSLNIVQVKATQREKFEADGKNIPIGLYVINGFVLQADGTYLSAKEFFSNPENKNLISNRSNITVEKQEKLKLRLENVLTELETTGFVGTAYRARLVNATYEQLLQIQAELKVETKIQKKNNDSDDDENDDLDDKDEDNDLDASDDKDENDDLDDNDENDDLDVNDDNDDNDDLDDNEDSDESETEITEPRGNSDVLPKENQNAGNEN